MLIVDNNTICLTRGDSCPLSLDIKNEAGEDYDFSGDTVVFTVKKSPNDKVPIINKTFNNKEILIEPADTSGLQYGQYYYDVQLTKEDGTVDTVITPTLFCLMNEITWG